MEVDCPSWNLLVHLDIDCNTHQDEDRSLIANRRYLVLVVFQRVVPSDEVKEGKSPM